MKKLLKKIGLVFKSLFSRTDKIWKGLTPEVQTAFLQGSEVLKIVNNNSDKSGNEILEIILTAYPDIELEKLKDGLLSVIKALNIETFLTAETLVKMLEVLSNYLKTKEKEVWAGLSALASKLIAYSLAGNLISWATLELLMEFVYHNFIKDK